FVCIVAYRKTISHAMLAFPVLRKAQNSKHAAIERVLKAGDEPHNTCYRSKTLKSVGVLAQLVNLLFTTVETRDVALLVGGRTRHSQLFNCAFHAIQILFSKFEARLFTTAPKSRLVPPNREVDVPVRITTY